MRRIIGIMPLVYKITSKKQGPSKTAGNDTATILCNSKSALQAIRKPSNKSGQRIINAILQAASEIKARRTTLRLQ
jgi:hypothetical protein